VSAVIPLPVGLFAWGPQRNTVRWDSEPYDDDGEGVILFDGSDRDPQFPVNLEVPRRGALTDFLYSPLLLLFVSSRARMLIEQYRTNGVTAHPLVLRDRRGAVVDDSYSWLNCRSLAPIMDVEKSGVEYREDGSIRQVRSFVVNRDSVPDADVFMCSHPTLRIFKEPLVRAIEASRFTGCAFDPLEGLSWPV
jgi:hypothetical protein